MLDRISLHLLKPMLQKGATLFASAGITADQVSLAGFLLGLGGAAAAALHFYGAALVLILLNRAADGLDGVLARQTGASDGGAYLDICLDFIFYSAVVFGFALADPGRNGLPAAALIFSFVANGSSFLAYAIMAERRKTLNTRLPNKGFYYLGGLMEGTETVLFFLLFCLFPCWFPPLAFIFASLCCVAAFGRILYGYQALSTSSTGK